MTPQGPEKPEHLPMPLPSGGPTPAPSVTLLARLLRYRFFLVALVIILFFAALFAWQSLQGMAPSQEAPPAAALSPEEAPGKAPEAGHALAPAPAQEAGTPAAAHPTPAAPVPAPLAPPREPAKGEIFTRALIKIMDDQVNGTWFGWRPNSIIFGKMGLTDNVNNIQLSVLEVARRTIEVLNVNMTRFATTEAFNPQVNEAMNFLQVSPDKYWFPSASGKYQEAMHDLERYIEGLHQGRSRFYTRVDHLMILLGNYKDLLGNDFHNLIKDTDADGKPVSWWVADDYFYRARGTALGMAEMLEAVSKEFHSELQKKNSHKLLDPGSAWQSLEQVKAAHPNVPILAVINPNSGPGSARDTNYVNGINQLRASGILVLGYVYTSYGARSAASVEADINSYHSWYAVDGIMFDEMSNVAGNEGFYSTVSQYAKSVGFSYTVGNPGAPVPSSFLGTVDNIVIYENAGTPSLSYLQAHAGSPKADFSAVAYGVSSVSTSWVSSASSYVQWIGLTDDVLPNPYDTLPSYLSTLVAALDSPAPPSHVALTVNSADVNGTFTYGMPIVVSANGTNLASGYTSLTFNATSGAAYNVSASDYGSYLFDHWSTGSTSRTISVTPLAATTLVAYCRLTPPPALTISVASSDLSGSPLSGMPVVIKAGASTVASGYTPLTYSATSGTQYAVTVSNYGSYVFDHWSTGSTSPTFTLTPTVNTSLVAYCRPSPPPTFALTISSADGSGNPTSNMPVMIQANGTTVASGYTSLTYNATPGIQYTVTVSDYGTYCFDHWSTGSTNSTLTLVATSATSLVAYCKDMPPPSSFAVKVSSADLAGNIVSGLWAVVESGGATVATGYTPLTYSATSGTQYTVTVSNYGSYVFDHWSTGSTNPSITLSPSAATTLTAYYRTPSQPATVSFTVKASDLSGKSLSGLLVVVKTGGTTVASGYSPLSFTANSGVSYTITVYSYGSYVFNHWSTGSTSSSIVVTPSQATTVVAYFKVVGSQGHH